MPACRTHDRPDPGSPYLNAAPTSVIGATDEAAEVEALTHRGATRWVPATTAALPGECVSGR
ncbi:hypothetical protein ACFPM0_28360 [Pseudonocardia sulfidoxydans]|uniref:hypothetical protein n=1 Tax=Pseudonocardia sulfidoxydans TaxID=54011 RepID=UPI003614E1E7